MKPRVLIADDHRIVAEGLSSLLEPGYDFIGIVENGLELLEAADEHHPDLIVADISMPQLNGIEAVRQLKKNDQQVKVVFLTMHPESSYVEEAFAAGGSGYVLKHSASTELLTALSEVSQGRTYVSPGIGENNSQSSLIRNEVLTKLSTRQRQVLQLLAEGRSAKNVGEALYISSRTVEFHKYKIMAILDIKSTAELVKFAIKYGIVTPE